MASRGALICNTNAASGRGVRDGLRPVIARRSRTTKHNCLDDLAEKVIELALGGNIVAIKEIGDRLDGKPRRQVALSGDAKEPSLTRVVRVIVDGTRPFDAPRRHPYRGCAAEKSAPPVRLGIPCVGIACVPPKPPCLCLTFPVSPS